MDLNTFLKSALTIPYIHQGRDYNGADCGGGIMLFYRDVLNITIPDFNLDYDTNWAVKGSKSLFIENYYQLFQKVEKPALYDIVLFQNKKGIANHGGVVLSNGRFWHISQSGSGINRYNDEIFKRRINGFYHFKRS